MRGPIQSGPLALLLTSLLPSVLAVFNNTCPAAITHANATGTVVFNDPITQEQNTNLSDIKQHTDDTSSLLSNATTLSVASTNLSYTLSVSTTQTELNGQKLPAILSALSVSADSVNLFNDTKGWAACAIPILNLPQLTTRYGQSDTGNCEATLPNGCVDKILKQVLEHKFTYSFTNDGLERICAAYGDIITKSDLGQDGSGTQDPTLPSECTNLFRTDNKGPGPLISKAQGFPITSENDTTPFSPNSPYQCPSVSPQLSSGSIKSYPFWNVSTQYNDNGTLASEGSYDEAVRRVYPVITVFFHGINANYFGYLPSVSTSMSCVRVNEFSQGSRVSAALQPATTTSHGELSKGAKAGIAVAVIVAVLGAIGVLAMIFLKKRRAGGRRKDYGQPRWYQNPAEVFRRGGRADGKGMEKSEYEMMTK